MCFHDGGTTPLYALGVGVERGIFPSYTHCQNFRIGPLAYTPTIKILGWCILYARLFQNFRYSRGRGLYPDMMIRGGVVYMQVIYLCSCSGCVYVLYLRETKLVYYAGR